MLRCLSLGLTLWAGAISAQTLEFVSATPITAEAATLGGLSAIETTDGSTALTVSDRGQFFDLTLERDTAGNITAARAAPSAKFTPSEHDTEGLAIGPSGAFAAFEGPATVRHINGAALPRHPDFRKMGSNAALEALAIDAQGRLFTLEESTGGADVPFALYMFSQGVWSKPHSIPRQHGFFPVGADFGADGRLYLLERQFTPFGFRSQIRRFDLDATPTHRNHAAHDIRAATRQSRGDRSLARRKRRDADHHGVRQQLPANPAQPSGRIPALGITAGANILLRHCATAPKDRASAQRRPSSPLP